VSLGQLQQSPKELLDPQLVNISWQRQRQERRLRLASHRCNVAQPTCQAAPSDRIRRVPFAAEMNVFQTEIGGYERFMALWELKDGAIVANAATGLRSSASHRPDLLNEFSFGYGHAVSV
jgi:hypothetical protein